MNFKLYLQPRSVIKGQRFDYDHFDVNTEDEQSPPSHQSLSSPRHIDQLLEETNVNQTLTQSYDLLLVENFKSNLTVNVFDCLLLGWRQSEWNKKKLGPRPSEDTVFGSEPQWPWYTFPSSAIWCKSWHAIGINWQTNSTGTKNARWYKRIHNGAW